MAVEPSQKDMERAERVIEDTLKVQKLQPTEQVVESAFPGRVVRTQKPDGKGYTWTADLKTREEVLRWAELTRPARTANVEAAKNYQATLDKVKVRQRNGDVVEMRPELAAAAERAGTVREPVRWGSRRRRVAWIDRAGKYHRAED